MKHIHPCMCPLHRPPPDRPLTALALRCWQRRHDRRPYNTMLLNRILFEAAFHRLPNADDYRTIATFVDADGDELPIDHFELNYMLLPSLDICAPLLRSIGAQMTHASLCHVDIGADHLRHLLLAGPCALLSLRLAGNPLNAQHCDVLHEFLLATRSLVYLDCGYCDLDAVRLATVADGMLHCATLRALDLSRVVQMHAAHQTDAAKVALLFAQLLWPGRLREAHFKHNNLDGHDVVPMAECLRRCRDLVYLDLGSNRLGAHGIKVLFDALRRDASDADGTTHLIGLDVSNNAIGEYGGLEIAHGLAHTKLRYLDIGRNGIPADAMRLILLTCRKRHALRIFNIVGNKFDYTVGRALRNVQDARVLMLDSMDVKCTYDADEDGFRVVPLASERSQYNQRYMRVQPFLRPYDVAPNLLWHDVNRRRLLVNGLFLDAIFVDGVGDVYSLDAKGRRTAVDCTKIYNF